MEYLLFIKEKCAVANLWLQCPEDVSLSNPGEMEKRDAEFRASMANTGRQVARITQCKHLVSADMK